LNSNHGNLATVNDLDVLVSLTIPHRNQAIHASVLNLPILAVFALLER